MPMKIKILRQKLPGCDPYWESFDYNGTREISVAGLLDHINYNDDIINDKGIKTSRIGWECSCLQGMCGACAMVINENPGLACETFLRDIRGNLVEIRPLRKFPVIHDLITDRSNIYENLKRTDVYIGEFVPEPGEDYSHQYQAAKCLKCGLCLEICPNYTNGEHFFGAVYANDCYLVSTRNREKARDIQRVYEKHFGNSCSKSLACMDVCPVNIPTIASMAKLNRKKGEI